MNVFFEQPMIIAQAVLIDADHRILLCQHADGVWHMPHGRVAPGLQPAEALVAALADGWGVTTFAKAFFPMTFATADGTGDVTLLYGCRNWIGANGLQHVADHPDRAVMWVRPARMGDYALDGACRMMMPVIMQMLGQGG